MRGGAGNLGESSPHAALLGRIDSLRSFIEKDIPGRFRGHISPDDILQSVWVSALRGLPGFKPTDQHAVDHWLMTIARSELVNAIRGLRRTLRGNGRSDCTRESRRSSFSVVFDRVRASTKTPSREFHALEVAHTVLIAVGQLGDARRKAIEMRYLEGRAIGEIAHEMGRTGAAVNGLLFRGRRELRSILGDAAKYISGVSSSGSTKHTR